MISSAYERICRDRAWRERLEAAGFRVLEEPEDAPSCAASLRHAPGSYANFVDPRREQTP